MESTIKDNMDIGEVAKYLHCTKRSIRKLIKENEIPFYQIYGNYYFNKFAISMWLGEKIFSN